MIATASRDLQNDLASICFGGLAFQAPLVAEAGQPSTDDAVRPLQTVRKRTLYAGTLCEDQQDSLIFQRHVALLAQIAVERLDEGFQLKHPRQRLSI